MSDRICPFCNGELVGTIGHPICRNQDCVMCDDPMPQDLLEELIRTKELLDIESSEHSMCHTQMFKTTEKLERTRKALDIATKYIKHTQKVSPFWFNRLANETLDKIKTALEQKGVNND